MIKKKNNIRCFPAGQYKEAVIEQTIQSENAWQRWQASYNIIRKKIFSEILKYRDKGYKQ